MNTGEGHRCALGLSYERIAAQHELVHILDAIADKRGLATALDAAGALRRAMAEGRITGNTYRSAVQTDGGCVIGQLAMALGWHGYLVDGVLSVPGWEARGIYESDLEAWVRPVAYGMTPENNQILATIDGWVRDWIQRQRALPGDAASL